MDTRFSEIKNDVENDNADLAIKKTKKLLEEVRKIPITIAITGESGSGKSTLVNALRGVDNKDKNAALTGCVETTMEPTPYTHPNFPCITVWDLPGVGTTRMKADQYLEHVGFQKYDFFLIVSETRFRENDAKLALEIQKMEKKFYFVRSKIDHNISDERRSQAKFDEAKTLKKIRDNCFQELEKLGVRAPTVFLVSSFDLQMYNFPALMETLQTEMPQHQRDALLLAVPTYNLEIIDKKKAALQGRIPSYIVLSVLGGFVPGFSVPNDINLINNFANECKEAFNLTEQSLVRLSNVSNVRLRDLEAVMKLSLSVNPGETVSYNLYPTETVAGAVASAVPLFGIPFAAALSGSTMSPKLYYVLNNIAEDAQNVFKKALGL